VLLVLQTVEDLESYPLTLYDNHYTVIKLFLVIEQHLSETSMVKFQQESPVQSLIRSASVSLHQLA
jgi:hypothetical protein